MAALVQWHSRQPRVIVPPPIRIELNAPYWEASPLLKERMDDFAAFAAERGQRLPIKPSEMAERYSMRYGNTKPDELPWGLSPWQIFVRIADLAELNEAASLGWKWSKEEKNPQIPQNCLGFSGRYWIEPNSLMRNEPKDPSHNWGIMPDSGERYACCGLPKDHPGCWKGTERYTLVPYDVAPSFSSGEMWQFYADAGELRNLWLRAPRVGTAWRDFDYYRSIDAKIRILKEQIADDMVRAIQEQVANYEDEETSRVDPWVHLENPQALHELLSLQRIYNRPQCTEAYDVFALGVAAEFFRNYDAGGLFPLGTLSLANLREKTQALFQEKPEYLDSLVEFDEALETMQTIEDIADLQDLGVKMEQLQFMQNYLPFAEMNKVLTNHERLRTAQWETREFRRAFNKAVRSGDKSVVYRPPSELNNLVQEIVQLRKALPDLMAQVNNGLSVAKLEADRTALTKGKLYQRAAKVLPEMTRIYLAAANQKLFPVRDRLAKLSKLDTRLFPSTLQDEIAGLRVKSQKLGDEVADILDEAQIEQAERLAQIQGLEWGSPDFVKLVKTLPNLEKAVESVNRYRSVINTKPLEDAIRANLAGLLPNRVPLLLDQLLIEAEAFERRDAQRAAAKLTEADIPRGFLEEIRKKLRADHQELLQAYKEAYELDRRGLPYDYPRLLELSQARDLVLLPIDKTRIPAPVKVQGSPILSNSALKWRDNSCWIDAPLTALFSLPETELEERLRSRNAIHVPKACQRGQAFYEAIMEDIAYLQNDRTPEPELCRSIRFFQDCVSIPRQGKDATEQAENFLINFIKLFGLEKDLVNFATTPLIGAAAVIYTLAQPEFSPPGYELFSLLRFQPGRLGHFVAGTRDPSTEEWWHVNMSTRRPASFDELISITPDEFWVMGFYMRRQIWDSLKAKAKGRHPLLSAIESRNIDGIQRELLEMRNALPDMALGLRELGFLDINAAEWIQELARSRNQDTLERVVRDFPETEEDFRELNL